MSEMNPLPNLRKPVSIRGRISPVAARLAVLVCALLPLSGLRAESTIQIHVKRPGLISLNIVAPDGSVARHLIAGSPFAAGNHKIEWNGLDDHGTPLPAGEYTWSTVYCKGLGLQLRGWIGDWGGDLGVPTSVATDKTAVYLGWSLASANGDTVISCAPDGALRWTHHRGPLSGCHALAVDGGAVFVLGGEGADTEGGVIYKLNAETGAPMRWSNGLTDLKITSLWPKDGSENTKPKKADYLAVKNGHIYVGFTTGDFVSVLDAKSGAYLQTIVGPPPGALACVATQSDTPDNPGTMVDADFLLTALPTLRALGKMLMVHDPIWVVASDLTMLGPDEHITALSMVGDDWSRHKQEIFVGMDKPLNQVQARSAIDSENVSYVAGKAGERAPSGPWDSARLNAIRSVGLDIAGHLWVAEGSPSPARISVWTTDTPLGKVLREYFAPPRAGAPVAVNPGDPSLVIAGDCEWRIDPVTGRASCLGVILPNPMHTARFVMQDSRVLLVTTPTVGDEQVLERKGDGDYQPASAPAPKAIPAKLQLTPLSDYTWQIATADGHFLGVIFQSVKALARPPIQPPVGHDWPPSPFAAGSPVLAETRNGKVFVATGQTRVWTFELKGAETIQPLESGKIALAANEQ